jgi:FkbM family methyltransferase
MSFAPICVFVYNRPWHTEQTLNALMQNELADKSILYIFSDGPKENASNEEIDRIKQVRQLICKKKWCKEVQIRHSKENIGLADSIIDGITEVVEKHGKIIVLEDDIVTSSGFLNYMNNALDLYMSDAQVYHISGYMFPVKGNLPETFFYKQTSCWGWGTWSDRWAIFEKSPSKLFQKLNESGMIKVADFDGTDQFLKQLKENIEGRIRTWAVIWHFSVFLRNGLSLHPGKSLVVNIGFDNTGSNCLQSNIYYSKPVEYVSVEKTRIRDYKRVYKLLRKFYTPISNHNLMNRLNGNLRPYIPAKLKMRIKMLTNKKFKENEVEKLRIQNFPRFTETETVLLDKKIKIVDSSSFIFLKEEIFDQEIYKFNCDRSTPYIIDCGANIGLSIIYFKQLFPAAEIIGFEPDSKIFRVLQENVESFHLSKVNLLNQACWNEETTLVFYSQGADGGRRARTGDKENLTQVQSIRLRNFINRRVDLLKMDIEGAENEVLSDIEDLLGNVERIFVEYHSFVGKEQGLSEILAILRNAGFRFNIHQIGVYSPNPFIKISDHLDMDLQLNIYGYRL